MKQGKTLLVLLVLLILCGGVYLALRSYNENQEDVDDTIYLTDLGEVTNLSFTGTDGSDLSFTKTDDTWTWNGDETFPADQDALDALAEDLGQLAAVRVFDEPDSLDAYGLDAPTLSCTAANAGGDTVTVLLGDEVDGNTYAMVEGESRVATVAATLADELQVSLMDLAEPENIPDVTQGTLASIRWQSGDTDLLLEKATSTEGPPMTTARPPAPPPTPGRSTAWTSRRTTAPSMTWSPSSPTSTSPPATTTRPTPTPLPPAAWTTPASSP